MRVTAPAGLRDSAPGNGVLKDDALRDDALWARDWLFEAALPLWWERGADRSRGGFFDKLDLDGNPVPLPRRVRVQARQVYVYAQAGRLGWPGPWREAMRHGLDFMLCAHRREDGLFRASVGEDGRPADDNADLYDQAFVIFALAHAHAAEGGEPRLLAEASGLLGRLQARLAHPLGGFEEAVPRRLPLRSNPHMHLLEALLAWVEAGHGEPFRSQAAALVDLALARMIDPATGAVGEYFDGDWRRAAAEGGLREPGHQFEWAYLLDLAGGLLGRDLAAASRRLEAFGSRHGIDRGRGVAVFALDADGAVTDAAARLWAQTERLRTALVLWRRAADGAEAERLAAEAADAVRTLRRFLDVPARGLWHERMRPDGGFIDEPAPASSLYHIVTGLVPLLEAAGLVPPA